MKLTHHIIDKQLSFAGTKGPELCGNDDLYADLDMDEVDLNFENYEELFGLALNNSEELFENGGIASLFGTTDVSGADSNCQGTVAAEVNAPPLLSCVSLPLFSLSVIGSFLLIHFVVSGISISSLHCFDVHFCYRTRKANVVLINTHN